MFTPRSQTKAAKNANKGKDAEEAVQDILKEFASNQAFDFERNYDAKSAQGLSYARRCGDFTWYTAKQHGVIEVKETANLSSLPYKNMEPHQAGKLARRKMAGGSAFVIIHHTRNDVWRLVPIDAFRGRPDTDASWDLSSYAAYEEARMLPIFDFISACMTP